MEVPVCVDNYGKAGAKGGKSGNGKAGKSGSGKSGSGKAGDTEGKAGLLGKSGHFGNRTLEEIGNGKGSGKGSAGKGKGHHYDDECLPPKKSKPKDDGSHKKIAKDGKGKSGKGESSSGKSGKSAKSGKSGTKGGKAGKAAKKIPTDSEEKLHKLGDDGKGAKGKGGKDSVSSETKALTLGKGKGGSKTSTEGSLTTGPTRTPKKDIPAVATRAAKLVKGPTAPLPPKPTEAPSFRPTTSPPTTNQPAAAAVTPPPSTEFAQINSQYLQSRMYHWLHQEEHVQEGAENDRKLRR